MRKNNVGERATDRDSYDGNRNVADVDEDGKETEPAPEASTETNDEDGDARMSKNHGGRKFPPEATAETDGNGAERAKALEAEKGRTIQKG